MGASKKEFFPEKQKYIATLCKALGHPARVTIIEYLLVVEECIAEDILEIVPLSRPTIWQHLQELKHAQIIQGNFKNNTFRYKINSLKIENVKSYFLEVLEKQKR
jgi:ArsR family transcriptional regulator